MDANPNQDLQYIWTLNGIELTSQFMLLDQTLMRFEANRSRLIYTPRKPEHYGQFKCIGISSLGSSDDDEMCMISLVPAGVPDVLSNCTQFNLTQQSFTLSCLAGFNGGLEQNFHMELWIKKSENSETESTNRVMTTSNNEQSNEISPIQNLPTVSSDLTNTELVLEKPNLIDKTKNSSLGLENQIKNDKQISNELNVNHSRLLLSSINLNGLNDLSNPLNSTNANKINNSIVDLNKTEKELRKINYGLMRKNSNKLLNMNTLNLNNSETYDRLIRRLKEAKFYLLANLTSFDYPFFSVYSLPVNAEFQLIIYASNSKGRSKELHLSGNTLLASHWQTGKNLKKNQLYHFIR